MKRLSPSDTVVVLDQGRIEQQDGLGLRALDYRERRKCLVNT